jgi:hypothetical protein
MIWRDNPASGIVNRIKSKAKPITPDQLASTGSETGEQRALFAWAALSGYPQLKWLHAVPNGGERNDQTRMALAAEGVRNGVWDVFLPWPVRQPWNNNGPDGSYHGLYIEMKRANRRNHKNGGLTDEQVAFGEYASRNGYKTAVCYSWEEARDIIVSYLEGR